MAETQEVINPGGEVSPFAPSLMSQAKDLLANQDTQNQSALPSVEYKPEDLEGIFTMPFDAAAFIAKRKIGDAARDIELDKKELESLCRIWSKPFASLAQRYPTFPWVIAGTMTMGIIVEKILIFYIAKDEMDKRNLRNTDTADNQNRAKQEELQSARG